MLATNLFVAIVFGLRGAAASGCVPFSEQACRDAASDTGKTVTTQQMVDAGTALPFSGSGSPYSDGCYSYQGYAFYGDQGTEATKKAALSVTGRARVLGADCYVYDNGNPFQDANLQYVSAALQTSVDLAPYRPVSTSWCQDHQSLAACGPCSGSISCPNCIFCSSHGSCGNSGCTCDGGWTGTTCQTAEQCTAQVKLACTAAHKNECTAGSATCGSGCVGGYTGTDCATPPAAAATAATAATTTMEDCNTLCGDAKNTCAKNTEFAKDQKTAGATDCCTSMGVEMANDCKDPAKTPAPCAGSPELTLDASLKCGNCVCY